MEENARGAEREEPEVGRGGGGRERLAARGPVPGARATPGPAGLPPLGTEHTGGKGTRRQMGRRGRRRLALDSASCNAPQPWLRSHLKLWGRGGVAVSWLCPPPPGAQKLSPGGVLGEPLGMGLDSHMQAGCLPPEFPAARGHAPGQPWPRPGTAQPRRPPCRCHGAAHGQPATVRHAALPLRLGGQPSHASGPSVLVGRGQWDPAPPQNRALQLGKAATHRHASGTHTCFSPEALTETRQRDDSQAPPQTCYQVPGPAKFPRACTMYENTHPCVHAPVCACVRACMYILHCIAHRGLTHPLPSSLHIPDMCPPHPPASASLNGAETNHVAVATVPCPRGTSSSPSPPSGRN